MPESEPKPRLIEPAAPGQGQGWKAVLKNGKAAVVHEIAAPPAEVTAAAPRIQRLFERPHPALSPILAWGTDAAGVWIAVEPNEGTSLGTILNRGPLKPAGAATLGAAILSGVAALHEAGVAMGGFNAASIRVTGNGIVRLAGYPAAALRGAPTQNDLRADVRSCGMAICAAFGVDPAGAPAPASVPPGLVVTIRSMASGAMGPAADRAQGALREMAQPLLAPDRQAAAETELALRSSGREVPPATPFLPPEVEAALAQPEGAAAAQPEVRNPTEPPPRRPAPYDAPERAVETYPAIPSVDFAAMAGPGHAAPQPPAAAAPAQGPPQPAPAPTWDEAPPRPTPAPAPYQPPQAPVSFPAPTPYPPQVPGGPPPSPAAAPTPPPATPAPGGWDAPSHAPVPAQTPQPPTPTPAAPAPAAPRELTPLVPAPTWDNEPEAPRPYGSSAEPPSLRWESRAPEAGAAMPPAASAPAPTAMPPPATAPAVSPFDARPATNPPVPAAAPAFPAAAPAAPAPGAPGTNPPAPAERTWTPIVAPAWPGEEAATAEALAAAQAAAAAAPANPGEPTAERVLTPPPFPRASNPPRPSYPPRGSSPPRAASSPPVRRPVMPRERTGSVLSELPTWMIPAAVGVIVVLILAVVVANLVGHHGSSSTAGTASPTPTSSSKASPSPSAATPQPVPNFGPTTAAPIASVQICSPATPCTSQYFSSPETGSACDLNSCHLEVAIYFSTVQKGVPIAYTIKFFDRCTGQTTDLPGAGETAPTSPGRIISIPTDHLAVNIPSGVKSGAIVALAQQPAVAASAPLLIGADTCA